jgi:hypothetical protein
MTESEKKLFAQAVAEGLVEKYDAQIATIDENVVCSKRHNRRMQRILEGKSPTNGRISKKTIGAILLAAALLLTGCTAYVFRDEIRDFFVTAYDSFVKVTFDNDGQDGEDRIEDIYYPSQILAGYELVLEETNSLVVRYQYKNSEGNILIFEQYLLDESNHFIDSEYGTAELRTIDNYNFYYKTIDQQHHHMWNDGKYALVLTSDIAISDDDLVKLFGGFSSAN